MFGPALNRSHGDNDWIDRIIFAAGNGLQRHDDFRRKHDRVFRFVRIGAVPAHAAHGDVYRIDICVGVTPRDADFSCFQKRVVVIPEREIRFPKPCIKSRFQ